MSVCKSLGTAFSCNFCKQKAKSRLRVLRQSTTIDEGTKRKVEPLLKAQFMSSDESAIESDAAHSHPDSSDSEKDSEATGCRKKLIRHKLPWRSEEFETVLRSLDRKLDRRRDPRSKAMCLEVQMGENSLREKPEGLPDWANNLHHQLFA